MKTPRELVAVLWRKKQLPITDVIAAIEARDAEHRAELDAARAENVMASALIERLRGELGKAELRLAALEAKGEPRTHAFVFDGYHAVTSHCRMCGNPDGPPYHPKGAKP